MLYSFEASVPLTFYLSILYHALRGFVKRLHAFFRFFENFFKKRLVFPRLIGAGLPISPPLCLGEPRRHDRQHATVSISAVFRNARRRSRSKPSLLSRALRPYTVARAYYNIYIIYTNINGRPCLFLYQKRHLSIPYPSQYSDVFGTVFPTKKKTLDLPSASSASFEGFRLPFFRVFPFFAPFLTRR